jgi:F0F1-type ATP synthase membrane subunit b/b'
MKKILTLAICFAVVICGVLGAAFAGEESKVSSDEVRKQAESAFDTAKKFAEQQKAEYQKKIESELTDLGNRIGQLKERAESASGDALAQLQSKMADLREKQKAAENRLGQFKSSTEQTWNEMKEGLDRAVGDLKKAYDGAAGFFK